MMTKVITKYFSSFLLAAVKENETSQLKKLIFGRQVTSPDEGQMIIKFLGAQVGNGQQTKSEGQQTTNSQSENVLGAATEAEEHKSISLFERILSTPNSSNLIKLIWDKFELSKKPEILSLVSFSFDYLNFTANI